MRTGPIYAGSVFRSSKADIPVQVFKLAGVIQRHVIREKQVVQVEDRWEILDALHEVVREPISEYQSSIIILD